MGPICLTTLAAYRAKGEIVAKEILMVAGKWWRRRSRQEEWNSARFWIVGDPGKYL